MVLEAEDASCQTKGFLQSQSKSPGRVGEENNRCLKNHHFFCIGCILLQDDSLPFKTTQVSCWAINIPQRPIVSVGKGVGRKTYYSKGLVRLLFFKGRIFSINYLLYTQPLSPITLPSQGQ